MSDAVDAIRCLAVFAVENHDNALLRILTGPQSIPDWTDEAQQKLRQAMQSSMQCSIDERHEAKGEYEAITDIDHLKFERPKGCHYQALLNAYLSSKIKKYSPMVQQNILRQFKRFGTHSHEQAEAISHCALGADEINALVNKLSGSGEALERELKNQSWSALANKIEKVSIGASNVQDLCCKLHQYCQKKHLRRQHVLYRLWGSAESPQQDPRFGVVNAVMDCVDQFGLDENELKQQLALLFDARQNACGGGFYQYELGCSNNAMADDLGRKSLRDIIQVFLGIPVSNSPEVRRAHSDHVISAYTVGSSIPASANP